MARKKPEIMADDIQKYKDEIRTLTNLLLEITDEEMNYNPIREDGWSIKKHVLHILNSESQSLIRTMSMSINPKERITVLDSKEWIDSIKTDIIGKGICINYLQNLSTLNLAIVQSNSRDNYEKKKVKCVYNGEEITVSLKENIESSIDHLKYHKEYIDKNLLEYKEIKS